MIANSSTPGLRLVVVPPPAAPSPLRTDIAAFLGRTRRGPVGRAVRVEGWREYRRVFGSLTPDADTPFAVRGYFENDGEVAYVVRLFDLDRKEPEFKPAEQIWTVGAKDLAPPGAWLAASPSSNGFPTEEYVVRATSPGAWSNGMTVTFAYRLEGARGTPEVDVIVNAPQEPPEYYAALAPATLHEEINQRSELIRLEPIGPKPHQLASQDPRGPRYKDWTITFDQAKNAPPSLPDYMTAITTISDEPEVALIAAPDLYRDFPLDPDAKKPLIDRTDGPIEILSELIAKAELLHDRLVLVDLPPADSSVPVGQFVAWADALGMTADGALGQRAWRAAAAYHPWVQIPDPSGGIVHPLRTLPPSGHVAGVISRLDRERGAHHTPANAPLLEAVDLTQEFDDDQEAALRAAGINLLRCAPGRGLQVWGGRTLQPEEQLPRQGHGQKKIADREPIFVAHRRLIHRLVRAIRRVAEPLVFDTNGPELWLTLVRAISTVLLGAYRAGALKGEREGQAFRVQCDEETNPPEAIDEGRCVCLIEFAPAVPMEFITLRVALSRDGSIELVEG